MTAAAPAANATVPAKPAVPREGGDGGTSDKGLLPREGAGVRVTVGGAGVRETMAPSHQPAGAGQRRLPLSQEGPKWKNSGSIAGLRAPLVEDAEPPHCAAGSEHSPGRLGWHPPGRGGAGGCSPLHRKTLGAGIPGARGDRWLGSGWVGGSRSQGKRAPPWGLGPQEITIITK